MQGISTLKEETSDRIIHKLRDFHTTIQRSYLLGGCLLNRKRHSQVVSLFHVNYQIAGSLSNELPTTSKGYDYSSWKGYSYFDSNLEVKMVNGCKSTQAIVTQSEVWIPSFSCHVKCKQEAITINPLRQAIQDTWD